MKCSYIYVFYGPFRSFCLAGLVECVRQFLDGIEGGCVIFSGFVQQLLLPLGERDCAHRWHVTCGRGWQGIRVLLLLLPCRVRGRASTGISSTAINSRRAGVAARVARAAATNRRHVAAININRRRAAACTAAAVAVIGRRGPWCAGAGAATRER